MSTEGIEKYLEEKNINEAVGKAITEAAKQRADAAYEFIAAGLLDQGASAIPGLADALRQIGEVCARLLKARTPM